MLGFCTSGILDLCGENTLQTLFIAYKMEFDTSVMLGYKK